MPKIILSYRRSDSDAIAGRIRDRLASHYGDESVFMDIDSIPFGLDFREHVKTALLQNDILLAVIGPKWIGMEGKKRTRINEETDPVRIEVETALARGTPVVPVLVGGASMPKPSELPEGLKDLAYRNAAQVDAGRDFHQHMERLLRSMDRILELKPGGAGAPLAAVDPGASVPRADFKAEPAAEPVRTPVRASPGNFTRLMASVGLRFADPDVERAFLDDYRARYYPLAQLAIGILIGGWMVFGSTALLASEGKELASIKFYYSIAAPVLLILFFASFWNVAVRLWQTFFALVTIAGIFLAYTSARLLEAESWFRPEYTTMAFMIGIALVSMAPILVVNALLLDLAGAVVALYYILHDAHASEFPALYTIFSCIFLVAMLAIGGCGAVVRETAIRRRFAAERALAAFKRG